MKAELSITSKENQGTKVSLKFKNLNYIELNLFNYFINKDK
jgi:hypothetical protein